MGSELKPLTFSSWAWNSRARRRGRVDCKEEPNDLRYLGHREETASMLALFRYVSSFF